MSLLRALKARGRRYPLLRRLAQRHSAVLSRMSMLMTRHMHDPIERAGSAGFFLPEDIDEVARVVFDEGHTSPRYQHLQHAHMTLPSWFRRDLDPYSPEYAEQQRRLWRLIAGVDRDYEPELDEKEAPLGELDAVRFPGFFLRRDPEAVASASDHIIASGMILKHAGVKPGGWALEYGAGFGHAALTLARLGVNVDTVDISATFCRHVQQQAEHFQVPLRAHQGHFGLNPRAGQRYDLVFFYESFHHCLEWQALIRSLPGLLAPGGRVLLCGEPMAEREYAAVPYPWGVRLQSDVVATIRRLHWFELGFSEDFLYEAFTRNGFTITRHACEPSLWGRTYVCEMRPAEVRLGQTWLPPEVDDGWHGQEPEGRWTKGSAKLALDCTSNAVVSIELANPAPSRWRGKLCRGSWSQSIELASGESRWVMIPATERDPWLRIDGNIRRIGPLRRFFNPDARALGVFVKRFRYDEQGGRPLGG